MMFSLSKLAKKTYSFTIKIFKLFQRLLLTKEEYENLSNHKQTKMQIDHSCEAIILILFECFAQAFQRVGIRLYTFTKHLIFGHAILSNKAQFFSYQALGTPIIQRKISLWIKIL